MKVKRRMRSAASAQLDRHDGAIRQGFFWAVVEIIAGDLESLRSLLCEEINHSVLLEEVDSNCATSEQLYF